MSDLNNELAKIHLEQRGYLSAMDVSLEEGGLDAPVFDVLGVKILRGMVSEAVVGQVRGWWHAGSYLTPGLIRSHLQTDRRFLSEAFSSDRIQAVRGRFGLGIAPIRKLLFFSQRSPGKSEDAEKILTSLDIGVVYLEDIILEMLPKVGKIPMGDSLPAQLLSMIRYSRLFREMRQALLEAQRCRDDAQQAQSDRPSRSDKLRAPEPQLDFISALTETREDDDLEE